MRKMVMARTTDYYLGNRFLYSYFGLHHGVKSSVILFTLLHSYTLTKTTLPNHEENNLVRVGEPPSLEVFDATYSTSILIHLLESSNYSVVTRQEMQRLLAHLERNMTDD